MQHDEQVLAILFDLGPLVRLARVFHRQVVQVEFVLHHVHQFLVRLEQAKPDEGVFVFQRDADVLDRDFFELDTLAIHRAVDARRHFIH